MRAVIQRVVDARVDVDGSTIASTGKGLVVLLGVEKDDTEEQARCLASKVVNMRIFDDTEGRMSLAVADVGGEILAVPQFTLAADLTKGRRPSFDTAAEPSQARRLFEIFVESMAGGGVNVAKGAFQKHMHVSLTNDGPVTFVLETS